MSKEKKIGWDWPLIIIILVCFTAFNIPIIIAYCYSTIADKFITTATLGDTFGGLTSPIINLVSIILLYLTLKKQNDSLKSQEKNNRTQRDFELMSRLISNVKSDFDNIKIEKNVFNSDGSIKNKEIIQGARAFYTLKIDLVDFDSNKYFQSYYNSDNLKAFYFTYNYLIMRVESVGKKNLTLNYYDSEKESFYDELKPIIEEIVNISKASGHYLERAESTPGNEMYLNQTRAIFSFHSDESLINRLAKLDPNYKEKTEI